MVCLKGVEEPHREGLDPLGLSSHETKIPLMIGPVNVAKRSFSSFKFTLFRSDETSITIDHDINLLETKVICCI